MMPESGVVNRLPSLILYKQTLLQVFRNPVFRQQRDTQKNQGFPLHLHFIKTATLDEPLSSLPRKKENPVYI